MPDPLLSPVGDGSRRAAALLDVVRDTLVELHAPARSVARVTLESSLERDLAVFELALLVGGERDGQPISDPAAKIAARIQGEEL